MSWVAALADWLATNTADQIPPDVLHAGCRATLDTIACAFGALDHPAIQPVGDVVRALGGPPESSLIGGALPAGSASQSHPAGEGEGRTSTLNAILFNGSLIRALDCNDIYIDRGIGGHPSDNLAVALAFAEAEHASGLEYLQAVVLGYELYWRLRTLFRPAPGFYSWDHVSGSGFVAAAMAGVLLRLDPAQLTNALAIGGAQTFTLSEVRAGEISMLKAAANARTAQSGALATLLARQGMSGPAEILEGERGLLAAIGRKPDDDALHALTASADHWHILDVAVKPYPSIGTSQGAVAATLALTREHRLTPDDVEAVEVRFADLPITHSQIGDAARADPQTRETADHSFPFLVAVAIEDGDLGPAQFADERWRRPATRELMRRVTMAADPRLNSHTRNGYPAAVTIRTRAGQTLHLDMLEVPGSPWNPLTDQQIGEKLRRFAPRTLPESSVATLERRLLQLDELPDVSELGPYLRGSAS